MTQNLIEQAINTSSAIAINLCAHEAYSLIQQYPNKIRNTNECRQSLKDFVEEKLVTSYDPYVNIITVCDLVGLKDPTQEQIDHIHGQMLENVFDTSEIDHAVCQAINDFFQHYV